MSTREERVQAARDTAMKALAARDLTRRELIELLVAKRNSGEVAEAAVAELEELGIVDEKRVAEAFVRSKLAEGPVARVMIEAALLERGVEAGLVTSVLNAMMQGQDEENEALELARLKVRTSPARLDPITIRRRVYAFLARRGFDEDVARTAVETAASEYLGRP